MFFLSIVCSDHICDPQSHDNGTKTKRVCKLDKGACCCRRSTERVSIIRPKLQASFSGSIPLKKVFWKPRFGVCQPCEVLNAWWRLYVDVQSGVYTLRRSELGIQRSAAAGVRQRGNGGCDYVTMPFPRLLQSAACMLSIRAWCGCLEKVVFMFLRLCVNARTVLCSSIRNGLLGNLYLNVCVCARSPSLCLSQAISLSFSGVHLNTSITGVHLKRKNVHA